MKYTIEEVRELIKYYRHDDGDKLVSAIDVRTREMLELLIELLEFKQK